MPRLVRSTARGRRCRRDQRDHRLDHRSVRLTVHGRGPLATLGHRVLVAGPSMPVSALLSRPIPRHLLSAPPRDAKDGDLIGRLRSPDAARFIGSNPCSTCSQGSTVRLATAQRLLRPDDDVATSSSSRSCRLVITADVLTPVGQVLDGVDAVAHLAGQPASPRRGPAFERYVERNVMATQRMLEAVAEPSARFVYASSSSVYGSGTDASASGEAAADQPVRRQQAGRRSCWSERTPARSASGGVAALLLGVRPSATTDDGRLTASSSRCSTGARHRLRRRGQSGTSPTSSMSSMPRSAPCRRSSPWRPSSTSPVATPWTLERSSPPPGAASARRGDRRASRRASW